MKKPIAKLNPLECGLCPYQRECTFGVRSDDLYKACVRIRFEDCALYNGGTLYRADDTTTDIGKGRLCGLPS